MENVGKKRNAFIFINSKQVWLSEVVFYVFVATLLILPLLFLLNIVHNEMKIRENNRAVTALIKESVSIQHHLKVSQEKYTIAAVLDTFTRSRLKPEVIITLTNSVYDGAKKYGYDPFLVLSVIHVESMFKSTAKGQYRSGAYSGAFGLMQLKEETARGVAKKLGIEFNGIEDLMKPEINIALGIGYLTQMITMFKDLRLGILAYNQGPGTILNDLKNRRPLSTRYYKKVLKSYRKLKQVQSEYLLKISE